MSLKGLAGFISRNAPTILTICSAVGTVGTVTLAVQATPRALDHIYDVEEELDRKLDRKEIIQACWKDYIPTAISGVCTLACIFGARYCSKKQQEVLASGYFLAHATLQEYERVLSERVGESKARDIRDEVDTRIANRKSPPDEYISDKQSAFYTGHGNTLFYDVDRDEYFYSDIHYMEKSEITINRRLINGQEPYIDLNEIRAEWGLPFVTYGSEEVVTPEHLLELNIVPQLMENNDVRINLRFNTYPKSKVLTR